MSTAADAIVARFRAMPRALQWATLAAFLIGGFLLADSTVWAVARGWSDRAEAIQAALDEARQKKASLDRDLRTAITTHGAVRIPGDEAEGSAALAEAVNEIMKSHAGVTNFSYDSRGSARLPSTALRGIVGAGQRASRITGELQFDAPPEQATAIVAELEAHPDIEAISRLAIVRHEGARRVTVRATVDAWVLSSRDDRRRGSA